MPQNIRELLEKISNESHSYQIEKKRECLANALEDTKERRTKELAEQRECVPIPTDVKKRVENWKNNT